MFLQALDVEARALGPDQPETAQTRYDFACLLVRSGQVGEAFSLLGQAIDHGLPPATPALLAQSLGHADQTLVRTTIAALAERLAQDIAPATAVILFGALAEADK